MRVAFLVSSVGDTDLAKATIARLIEEKSADAIFLIPLSPTAVARTLDLKDNKIISLVSLEEITKQAGILSKDKISAIEAEAAQAANKVSQAVPGALLNVSRPVVVSTV